MITGKSLDFCKERVRSGQAPNYSDRDFSFAIEHENTPLRFLYATGITYPASRKAISGKDEWTYSICFDDGADYNYFVSESAIHDGTLAFELKPVIDVIERIANGSTYNNAKGKPYNGCHIKYTVGNLVVINEFNGRGFNDVDDGNVKLRFRTTAMLPVKYEIEGSKDK